MWGIQIPTESQNKILFDFLLKQCSSIWARDDESVHALKQYWYQNVDFFMDTAFYSYDWDSKKTKWIDKYIVININKNGSHFAYEMLEDIRWYITKWYWIFYVPVSKWSQKEYNDIEFLSLIQKEYPKTTIQILDREENFSHFIDILANASMVLSARLHLFLIASFLRVPTKIYPYQHKIIKMQKIIEKYFSD